MIDPTFPAGFDAANLSLVIDKVCQGISDCYNSQEFWLQIFILVTGVWAQVLIAKKNLNAFYFWMIGNIAIIFSALPKAQYGIALLYFLSIGFNLYGVMQWRKDVTRKEISPDATNHP